MCARVCWCVGVLVRGCVGAWVCVCVCVRVLARARVRACVGGWVGGRQQNLITGCYGRACVLCVLFAPLAQSFQQVVRATPTRRSHSSHSSRSPGGLSNGSLTALSQSPAHRCRQYILPPIPSAYSHHSHHKYVLPSHLSLPSQVCTAITPITHHTYTRISPLPRAFVLWSLSLTALTFQPVSVLGPEKKALVLTRCATVELISNGSNGSNGSDGCVPCRACRLQRRQ
jgi:hypothetical protein